MITKLLLEEIDRDGRLSLRGFYGRRARRLLPALCFACGVVLLVSGCAGILDRTWFGCLAALGYFGNYAWLAGADLGPMGVTYTLAIEEHFYLLWPALLPLVARRRDPVRFLGFIMVAVVAVRIVLLGHGMKLDFSSATAELSADRLLAGAALAFVMHRRGVPRVPWAVPAALLIGCALARGTIGVATIGYLTAAFGTAALIAALVSNTASVASRALASRPAIAVGRVSYGLYLWHFIVYWFTLQAGYTTDGFTPTPVAALVALVISVTIATASWHFVERPLSTRRNRLGSRAGTNSRDGERANHAQHVLASALTATATLPYERRGLIDAR